MNLAVDAVALSTRQHCNAANTEALPAGQLAIILQLISPNSMSGRDRRFSVLRRKRHMMAPGKVPLTWPLGSELSEGKVVHCAYLPLFFYYIYYLAVQPLNTAKYYNFLTLRTNLDIFVIFDILKAEHFEIEYPTEKDMPCQIARLTVPCFMFSPLHF